MSVTKAPTYLGKAAINIFVFWLTIMNPLSSSVKRSAKSHKRKKKNKKLKNKTRKLP